MTSVFLSHNSKDKAFARKLLKKIEFGDDFVRIITNHYQFELDLRKVDKEEIEQAKTILQRMNFDNRFEMRQRAGEPDGKNSMEQTPLPVAAAALRLPPCLGKIMTN